LFVSSCKSAWKQGNCSCLVAIITNESTYFSQWLATLIFLPCSFLHLTCSFLWL
jgi:hypothetical protein